MSLRERWREWRESRLDDERAAEEMAFHIDLETERNISQGMKPAEARLAAVRAFGGVDRFREVSRDERTGSALADLVIDVRYALRSLRSTPGFAAVALLTLALGIGANSGIFSVLNAVVIRPLAYEHPDALVRIESAFPTVGFKEFMVSGPEFFELQDRTRSFSSMGGYRVEKRSIGTVESPLRVNAALATHDLLPTLGVVPVAGRWFDESESVPGATPVAMLSYRLWQRAFGGDRAIVGRSVVIDGVTTRITGVMPAGFDAGDAGIEVWVPFGTDRTKAGNRGGHVMNVIARVRPGVSQATAAAELATVVAAWPAANPDQHAPSPDEHPMFITPIQEDLTGEIRPTLLLLLGAVGFVLLIACANVGNLLLARAGTRQREIAVRAALGAGRRRLLRQFLTEGIVLGLIGGALGLVTGYAGVQLLIKINPGGIPRAGEIRLDATVVLFTIAVSIITGLLFGLAPAAHLSAGNMNASLRDGGQRTTSSSGRERFRRALVVAETALAVVLVAGSALMLRSFAALQTVDPGFDSKGLLAFDLYLPAATYPDASSQATFFDAVLARLGSMPGVTSATAAADVGVARERMTLDIEIEGYVPRGPDGPSPITDQLQFITDGYHETLGIPVVAGRAFARSDATGLPVVLINEQFAAKWFPGKNPLGRRLRLDGEPDDPWFTVVGVIRDVKQGGLGAAARTEVYHYYPQSLRFGRLFDQRTMSVVMRTVDDPAAHAASVRALMHEMDPSLPVANLQPVDDVIYASMARPRFLALLLGVFAAVALTLAAIGIYGVMAYSVAQRQKEIGIRMALGAHASGVLSMVLRQGLGVTVIGLAVGTAGALVLTRLLDTLLFRVSTTDPLSFISAPLLLGAVALLACYIPARRATRVDPSMVLKES